MVRWHPNVFIIESLNFNDEKNDRFEGKILSQILHLGGKKSIYYYIRTKKELEKVLEIFDKSEFRYLHISCHGSETSLSTTLDNLSFSGLAALLKPHLNDKRLFVSACSAVNDDLAKVIIPHSDCISLIGPKNDIGFHDAAIIWASFYHLIFKKDPDAMKRKNILPILKNVANTFDISLNYFSNATSPYHKTIINPKKIVGE